MFEHRKEKLLSIEKYRKRLLLHFVLVVVVISCSLFIGVLGYHIFEGFGWTDSPLNASMILGGMGPVNEVKTEAGKVFASIYALYSGIVFLVVAGLMFAPIFHRFLHKFHLDNE